MDKDNILKRLFNILQDKIAGVINELVELNKNMVIRDIIYDNYFDSLDCVETVMDIEKEFSIILDDNKIDGYTNLTISEFADVIMELMGETPEKKEDRTIVSCVASDNIVNVANSLICEDVNFSYTSGKIYFFCAKSKLKELQEHYSSINNSVIYR